MCLSMPFFIEFATGKQVEFFHSLLLKSESQSRCEGSSENIYGALRDIISKLLLDKIEQSNSGLKLRILTA